jgi:hypothetical protein
MKGKEKGITTRELREKLTNIDIIEQQIHNYTVVLGRYIVNGKRYHAVLVGSGTLILIGEKYGILTAQHVIPILRRSDTLLISIASYRHRCEVDIKNVDFIELSNDSNNEKRPDLAFVLLRGSELDNIKAKKSFWNMSYWKSKVLSDPSCPKSSLWIISGHPEAYTKTEGPSERAIEAKCFRNMLGYTCIKREFMEGEFDYFETGIFYKTETNIPKDFGGVSGGGLWQIPISESQDGTVQANGSVLLGVAFKQTDIVGNKTEIICYGRHSIYNVLYDLVEQTYSH